MEEINMAFLFLNQQKVINQLEIAESFIDRGIGLLHHSSLSIDQAMFKNVRPFRVILPQWKAHSVIEFSAGFIEKYNLKIGETLHVGD